LIERKRDIMRCIFFYSSQPNQINIDQLISIFTLRSKAQKKVNYETILIEQKKERSHDLNSYRTSMTNRGSAYFRLYITDFQYILKSVVRVLVGSFFLCLMITHKKLSPWPALRAGHIN
jgi:hypothetical protein